jgi:hypothetical protein
MIHLFVNALAASAGGGLTYVRNIIPQLALRQDTRATVLLDAALRRELQQSTNVSFVERENLPGAVRRAPWVLSSVTTGQMFCCRPETLRSGTRRYRKFF